MTIRNLRRDKGMSQTALANASGIPQPTLSEIETGKRPLFPGYQIRIAAALNIPADALTM
jgi:transcriptional regulator with XRE-family HTH domain